MTTGKMEQDNGGTTRPAETGLGFRSRPANFVIGRLLRITSSNFVPRHVAAPLRRACYGFSGHLALVSGARLYSRQERFLRLPKHAHVDAGSTWETPSAGVLGQRMQDGRVASSPTLRAMYVSMFPAGKSLIFSIALLWNACSGGHSLRAKKSTIKMVFATTIDLRTLSFGLSGSRVGSELRTCWNTRTGFLRRTSHSRFKGSCSDMLTISASHVPAFGT